MFISACFLLSNNRLCNSDKYNHRLVDWKSRQRVRLEYLLLWTVVSANQYYNFGQVSVCGRRGGGHVTPVTSKYS